jgi:hypothetical protein
VSRQIELKENELSIHLIGWTSIAALKNHVEFPYTSIKKVSVETFTHSPISFRVGTALFDKVCEGIFLIEGKWCFLSYGNNENVIVLELEDQNYWKVVVQVENPEDIAQLIKEKCTHLS